MTRPAYNPERDDRGDDVTETARLEARARLRGQRSSVRSLSPAQRKVIVHLAEPEGSEDVGRVAEGRET
ncbi:hypothetical protein [Methylobacterium segetis]|uniref:hypothetical protein n=1 Tax=Methylobacterium segetis TaxID=2488750 RepID=UPI001044295B|nr:hypothetical protein [Methylobacterium segetis]